ncbi:hypothetical protein IA539_16695 [Gordonia sp. zg691]|uniref:Anti-sigma-M factor RsmA n=1 Tax=Gordonia jinghuaiqii TaxID=2758710 RepID=A0A7D7LTE1_9ACTN|nr:hypothetical protein [Gordonia jinghuaiqii]MBD0862830.1 hypothetical protein [Gordonia jinghuaiqii]MCR5979038.1 hypothetical protein [Gordonia jinghuaiqii]QMT01637.1 hypothetical protein H1R19_23020 [Gordonia jinghuaiqii]
MTPRGPDDNESGDLPDPPYSVEMLADFHAGVLSGRTTAHIRARIVDDAAAQEILSALDRTAEDLRGARPEIVPTPDSVRADVDATLAMLGGDRTHATAPFHTAPFHTAATPEHAPDDSTPGGPVSPTDLHAARRSRTRRTPAVGILLAAAAVVLIAVGSFGVLRLTGSPADQPAPPQAQPTSSLPTSSRSTLAPGGSVAALSVLGRTDGAPFGSVAALRRCTAAHLIPVQVVIVGSGQIMVDGEPAAAILLSTGVAGRFDALIVGLDCDIGNPALISRAIIGG